MRPIDADALENEVHTFCREFIGSCRDFRTKCALYDAMKGVLVRIYDAPTLSPDAVPVVRGEWIEFVGSAYHGVDDDGEVKWRDVSIFHCDKCGRKTVVKENFCPSCGARMKGAEDGTTDNS